MQTPWNIPPVISSMVGPLKNLSDNYWLSLRQLRWCHFSHPADYNAFWKPVFKIILEVGLVLRRQLRCALNSLDCCISKKNHNLQPHPNNCPNVQLSTPNTQEITAFYCEWVPHSTWPAMHLTGQTWEIFPLTAQFAIRNILYICWLHWFP